MSDARISGDFDEIARLSGTHGGGDARYDTFLTALVPRDAPGRLVFRRGHFLEMEFPQSGFDCVISAATLHHMPAEVAVRRMLALVGPGGTIVIHDMRSASSVLGRASLVVAPGATVYRDWFWKYTIVWRDPKRTSGWSRTLRRETPRKAGLAGTTCARRVWTAARSASSVFRRRAAWLQWPRRPTCRSQHGRTRCTSRRAPPPLPCR